VAPSGLYDRLCYAFLVFFFFILWAKLSQYLLHWFSRSFYKMEDICVNFLDPVHFFPIPQGTLPNLVNFCPATPEKMELIWERQVWQGQKTGVSRWVSPDILDGFSQYFHHMKALYLQMTDLYIIFQFVKGRCHGKQIMLPQWRQTDTTCIVCTFARW